MREICDKAKYFYFQESRDSDWDIDVKLLLWDLLLIYLSCWLLKDET